MSRRARRVVAVVAPLAAVAAVWAVASPSPGPGSPRPVAPSQRHAATPPERPAAEEPVETRAGRSLAVPVTELGGLAPDTTPGTRVDVWVAWGPRVSARPHVQLLVPGATIASIRPAAGEGPPIAVVAVDARRVSDLLYGYRYGDLAVVTRP